MNDAELEREFEKWKAEANDSPLLEAAKNVGAKLKRAGREWIGPCPWCGGTDRFSVNPGKKKWNCRGFGGGSTTIGMVMHAGQMSFLEAGEFLTQRAPPRGQAKPISAEEKAQREQKRAANVAAAEVARREEEMNEAEMLAAAKRIWEQSVPLAGTLGERYLFGFKLPVPPGGWPDVVRFNPRLYCRGHGDVAGIVARVDDASGSFTGIWREFISPDGKKAQVEVQKSGLGPTIGGAIRLGGICKKIGAAEGLRTALGAWSLIAFRYPVWSMMSTSGLMGFEPPLEVERIIGFPDGDPAIKRVDGQYVPVTEPPGRKAMLTMQRRMVAAGLGFAISPEPPARIDYLNLYQRVAANG